MVRRLTRPHFLELDTSCYFDTAISTKKRHNLKRKSQKSFKLHPILELFINLKINTFIDYAVLIKSMSQTYFKVIFKIVERIHN